MGKEIIVTDEMRAAAAKMLKIRKDLKMTRRQVEEKLGVPQRTIQTWEDCERFPPPYVAEWYEQAMRGIPIGALVTDVEYQELEQAVQNQIALYKEITPATDKQDEEIRHSIELLESAIGKIKQNMAK